MTRKQAQRILDTKGFGLHLKQRDGSFSAAKRDESDAEISYCRAWTLKKLVLKVVGGHAKPRSEFQWPPK